MNNNEDPIPPPDPNRWYNLTLGSSFKDDSSKFCTLRYEFKPASIDKNQPGLLHKSKDNKITIEFQNNQPGKPKLIFDGSIEDHKENDAVLLFDGETFRLERLHRAVKRLRHVRLPGESVAASSSSSSMPAASVGSLADACPSPRGKGAKFQPPNKNALHLLPVEVERIDVGEPESSGLKLKHDKEVGNPCFTPNPGTASPDIRNSDLEDALDGLNGDDDDDACGVGNDGNAAQNELASGIDINIPQQDDIDDEIADLVVSDDEPEEGRNAAEALRAQVNAEGRGDDHSSSSSSSGSESSGSASGSGSPSSSSDSESSDSASLQSI